MTRPTVAAAALAGAIAMLCAAPLPAEVIDLAAIINTAQEIPAPTGASAAGLATVQFDDATHELAWNVAWQGLTGPATGMHFHAPAGPGATAPVAVDIGSISGLTSPSIGSTVVSDEFANQLLAGQSYINIHTAQNAPGETRGQVSRQNILLSAVLDAAQETPAPTGVPANAGGSAVLAYDPMTNTLGWNIQWHDLSGPPTNMHFHGPAPPGQSAGVQLGIANLSGLTSPSIGSAVISDDFESQLLSGSWYINIHTAQNPAGEIRGQVVPEPSCAALALIGLAVGLLRPGLRLGRSRANRFRPD